MRYSALLLLSASVAFSQTQNKPAVPAAKPATSSPAHSTAKPRGVAPAAGAASTSTVRKPASDMPVLHGVVKSLFAERYEDIKIGTGAEAQPVKVYHVLYTGFLAATGQKFDSSADHPVPVMKDGKPELGPDGKPIMGPPQPLVFPQGMGRLIPGFDDGFGGMRIGGKRRIFIPWQLAYGTREIPPREGHIGIPAKSDLIFDVELIDVTDMPTQPLGSGAPRPVPPPTPGSQPTAPPTGTVPATPPPAASAPAGSAPAAPPKPN